jgi:hypothetical protein
MLFPKFGFSFAEQFTIVFMILIWEKGLAGQAKSVYYDERSRDGLL